MEMLIKYVIQGFFAGVSLTLVKKAQDKVVEDYRLYRARKAVAESTYDGLAQTYIGEQAAAAIGPDELTVAIKSKIQPTPTIPIAYHKMAGPEKAFAYPIAVGDIHIDPIFVQKTSVNNPYTISEEEFVNNQTNYEQVCYTYFMADNVLTNENGQPIEGWEELVGIHPKEKQDAGILYVRNERAAMIFEIVVVDGKSYTYPKTDNQPVEEEENKAQSDAPVEKPVVRRTRRARD